MIKDLTKQERTDAILSLQQYFERNMPEALGDLGAGMLLDFFLKDIGPLVYNHGINDAQARLQQRVSELDGELFEPPFTFWQNSGRRGR